MMSNIIKSYNNYGIRQFYITFRCYCQEKTIYQQNEEDARNEKVRTVYGKPYPEWRKPWIERKNEWRSKLSVFVVKEKKLNSLTVIQKIPHFNLTVMRDWWKEMKEVHESVNQQYISQRVEILGSNLAALHFFTHRGAAVRLKNVKKWLSGTPEDLKLPNKFKQGYFVEGIDCTNFAKGGLRYEGVQNLESLASLKWLSLKNNSHIDVWSLDRIAGLNGHTLEYLNISGCNFSIGCIYALIRMTNLKVLVLKDPGNNTELLEAIAFLEQANPELLVQLED